MFSDILRTLLIELGVVVVAMTVAFVIGQRLGRYDVADIAWGLVFIVIAATGLTINNQWSGRALLLFVLISIWGLRLSWHIWRRFRSKPGEDRRYADMRAAFGAHPAINAWLKIFVVQGLLALVVTLPVTITASTLWSSWYLGVGIDISESTIVWWTVLETVGVALWLIGFVFEALGDFQLGRFLASSSNRGKLMTTGLWRYSRHPNYFGEILQWWGIGVIASSVSWGWLGLIGPLTITALIVFISGIPLLEKHYAGRPDWEVYKHQTSVLIPWFPGKVKV